MQVIISQDKVYLSHGAERARLVPTYHSLIQRVRLRVKLPDMVIPLNPGLAFLTCPSRCRLFGIAQCIVSILAKPSECRLKCIHL